MRDTPAPALNVDEREIHAHAVFDERDSICVGAIQDELRRLGIRLSRLETVTGDKRGEAVAVVVFVSDALLGDVTALHAGLRSWQGPVIPVTLADLTFSVPETIRRRTALDARSQAPAEVARSIAVSVRASPEWALAWLELESSAERFATQTPGSPGVELLSADELERAHATVMARPRNELPALPTNVERLLATSERALRRRFVRRLTIMLGATALLALTGLFAVNRRHSALQAATRAQLAARRSEADRLSSLALANISSDPDLPILLARRAYRLAPGPGTRDTLRRALEAAPWHRSYRLPAPASAVYGSARSPLALVSLDDGTALLVDTRNGRIVARTRRPLGAAGTAVASIGIAHDSLVALAYNGGLVQVRTLDAAFRVVWSSVCRV